MANAMTEEQCGDIAGSCGMRDTKKISTNATSTTVTPAASGANPMNETDVNMMNVIIEKFVNILARPRQKEFVPVPIAGWPSWPEIDVGCRAHLHNGWPAGQQCQAQQEVQADENECRDHQHNGASGSEIKQEEPPSQADLDVLLAHLAPKVETAPDPKPKETLCGNEPSPIAADLRAKAPPALEKPINTSKSGAIACKTAAIKISNRYQELADAKRQ